jgi:hypothetical protein
MVFESIIVDLLNKLLGEYIQDLDYKQLKISLWGGMCIILFLIVVFSVFNNYILTR